MILLDPVTENQQVILYSSTSKLLHFELEGKWQLRIWDFLMHMWQKLSDKRSFLSVKIWDTNCLDVTSTMSQKSSDNISYDLLHSNLHLWSHDILDMQKLNAFCVFSHFRYSSFKLFQLNHVFASSFSSHLFSLYVISYLLNSKQWNISLSVQQKRGRLHLLLYSSDYQTCGFLLSEIEPRKKRSYKNKVKSDITIFLSW